MKKHVLDFIKRGLMAAWGGPVVIAVAYAILGANGVVETLTVREVCLAVISSTVMAFIAAGIPVIYQVERLPLPMAILIHCGVLYADYLLVYLINGWLVNQGRSIGVFTAIFLTGFALVWAVICLVERKKISSLNRKLHAR